MISILRKIIIRKISTIGEKSIPRFPVKGLIMFLIGCSSGINQLAGYLIDFIYG